MKKNYHELLEKYIDGELQGEELKLFEKEIDTNPEFNKEFNLHKEIDAALKEKGIIELRENIDSIHNSWYDNQFDDESCIKKIFRKKWQIAAAIVVLIIITAGLLYSLWNVSYSNDKIYSMFYKPNDVVMIIRSGNDYYDEILIQGLQKYEQKDYEGAISLFKKDNNNITARFYSGISYIEIKNFHEAINSFKYIIDNKDNLFIEQSEWYLGLCCLKTNETGKAKIQFKKIALSNSFYKSKAMDVLKYFK